MKDNEAAFRGICDTHTQLSEETHVVQRLEVRPEMTLDSFMRLFLLDDDCGLRFTRKHDGAVCEVELLWPVEDRVQVSIATPRDVVPSSGIAQTP